MLIKWYLSDSSGVLGEDAASFLYLIFRIYSRNWELLKEYYQDVPGANLDELFDTVEDAKTFIKQEFQKMFKNNAEEIFNANSQLFFGKQWNGVTITRWEILRDLAKDDPTFWQSEFFSFIKVQ